jgi:hypothetical protein
VAASAAVRSVRPERQTIEENIGWTSVSDRTHQADARKG